MFLCFFHKSPLLWLQYSSHIFVFILLYMMTCYCIFNNSTSVINYYTTLQCISCISCIYGLYTVPRNHIIIMIGVGTVGTATVTVGLPMLVRCLLVSYANYHQNVVDLGGGYWDNVDLYGCRVAGCCGLWTSAMWIRWIETRMWTMTMWTRN